MQTYEEFRASLLKINETRKHKVTGSIGVYQAYKWIRKNKWLDIERPLTEKEFYAIIRNINDCFAEELSKGNDVTFPLKMGRMELRKHTPFIGYSKGKLKVSLAIDWDATLKLWYEDEEAFEHKTLVKIPTKEIFRFYYNKHEAHYTNLSFYDLNINREIKVKLKTNIKNGTVDAFLSNR